MAIADICADAYRELASPLLVNASKNRCSELGTNWLSALVDAE